MLFKITRGDQEIELTQEEIRSAYYVYEGMLKEEEAKSIREEILGKLDSEEIEALGGKNSGIITSVCDCIIEDIYDNGCDRDWCLNSGTCGGLRNYFLEAMGRNIIPLPSLRIAKEVA